MWVQTGAYHLASLWWLIAIVVVFIIAVIALIVAGRAMTQARADGVHLPEPWGNREPPEWDLKRATCRNPSEC